MVASGCNVMVPEETAVTAHRRCLCFHYVGKHSGGGYVLCGSTREGKCATERLSNGCTKVIELFTGAVDTMIYDCPGEPVGPTSGRIVPPA